MHRTPAERERNKPPRELRPGYIQRHEALEIFPEVHANEKNSILGPGIEMATEVSLINQGLAERLPNNRYRINKRNWVDKGDGETFPESGEGIWVFSSPQFNLLKLLVRDGGRTTNADRMIANHPRLDDALAREVEALFKLIQSHRKRRED